MNAWRAKTWRRPGSRLAVGLEAARLADVFLDPGFFPIAGQRACRRGTSPAPEADEMSGDPAGGAARLKAVGNVLNVILSVIGHPPG